MAVQTTRASMSARALEIEDELVRAEVEVTLSAQDACDLLKIDRRTLGRLLSSRRLLASRISPRGSSKLLLRRREIARFLAQLES
jgi:hypothetical protein